ncbi:MAG: DUF1579 family protein [Nitrososphaerota archaeon]
MPESRSSSSNPIPQAGRPDPALKRLQKLVGTWELKGRTLDATEDTISGRVTIEWLPGGFFLQMRGTIESMGFALESLEILRYDPSTNTFPALVYSSMNGVPLQYWWDVQGDVVTHWTEGANYTGRFSDDGNILSGGWRPDEGHEATAGNTYDADMIRAK